MLIGRRMDVVNVVMLDIDGTLMDSNYLHTEAFIRAFEALGLPRPPHAAIHRQIGKGATKFLPDFVGGNEVAVKQVEEKHSQLYKSIQHRGYPLPGARELLHSLAERGLQVWLASSAKPDELEFYRHALDVRDKLAGIVTSGDVEEAKPEPDVFVEVLEQAGCAPGDAIVVGDTVWDVEAARKTGLRTVAVLTGGAFSQAELEHAGAVAVYQDCDELLRSGFPAGL